MNGLAVLLVQQDAYGEAEALLEPSLGERDPLVLETRRQYDLLVRARRGRPGGDAAVLEPVGRVGVLAQAAAPVLLVVLVVAPDHSAPSQRVADRLGRGRRTEVGDPEWSTVHGSGSARSPCHARDVPRQFRSSDPRLRDLVEHYETKIAATDEARETRCEGLEALGWVDDGPVVATLDQGEDSMEHGWATDRESIHHLLPCCAPRWLEPRRIARRAGHADVLPTLRERPELPAETGNVDAAPAAANAGRRGSGRGSR